MKRNYYFSKLDQEQKIISTYYGFTSKQLLI